jgi:imidazoleglycerol-phosphate dehydratase
VEDIGITLGQAFAKAVGDKAGLTRYGYAYVPLDEALSRVVLDLSGRPGLERNFNYFLIITINRNNRPDNTNYVRSKPPFKNHGLVDLSIKCEGDTQIDDHHSVEDIGITLGQAFAKAVGDKAGLTRYGYAYVPLDEALSRVVLDLSGRPGLELNVNFTRAMIGSFDVDLISEFFQGFVNHALITLHIDNLKGVNSHHQAETIFKAFGRALRMAITKDERQKGIPSTKGSL